MTIFSTLRAFSQSGLIVLEGNWLPPQETESHLPWLEAPMGELAHHTTMDANTNLFHIHKDDIPIQWVPFHKAYIHPSFRILTLIEFRDI